MPDLSDVRDSLVRWFEAADIATLGEIYCDYGGEEFFASQRDAIIDHGIAWGEALSERLSKGGTSLYVGAGVAELGAALTELTVLGRSVRATNLRGDECRLLNEALESAGAGDLLIEKTDAATAAAEGGFDHVAAVCVLSDPETFPQISGVSYGRLPPVLLDVIAFEAERSAASELVDAIMNGLTRPGLLTTSFEEVAWFLHWAERHDVPIEAEDISLESGVVGDDFGFLRVGE